MNRRKRFRELFRFRKDIRSQSSKVACPRSQWQRRQSFFANIFTKAKNFAKPFLPVYMEHRWSFFYEKNIENLVTLSLQRNHWLGHREWLTMYFAIFSKYFKLTYLRYAAICTVCFVPIGFFFIYKTHTKLLY